MNPMFIVAIPLLLVIVGMVLNSFDLGFNQPPSSAEQDPAKRAAAEADSYRRFFDLQRKRAVTRQKRVGQYAWLLIIAIIGSFIWLYMYAVKKTTATTQIAALQTLVTEEGKETVLSLTLKDGSNVKYLIKSSKPDTTDARHKRSNVENEGLILGYVTIRYGPEYRRESIACRHRTESVQRPNSKKRLKAITLKHPVPPLNI
jgi:hypothetical protein